MTPPPTLPFSHDQIPTDEIARREWLLASFGYFLRHFRTESIQANLGIDPLKVPNEEGENGLDTIEAILKKGLGLFALQELAMLAARGWSLKLQNGSCIRFVLSAEVVDENNQSSELTVINRDTQRFLPEYWPLWLKNDFPWLHTEDLK